MKETPYKELCGSSGNPYIILSAEQIELSRLANFTFHQVELIDGVSTGSFSPEISKGTWKDLLDVIPR